jgi:tRNA A37 methylthiotransferase MiaB
LRKIAELKKRSFLDQFTGREQDVLVQKIDRKTGTCRGLSRNYLVVSFPGNETYVNCEIKIKILHSDGMTCSGALVST